MPLNAGEQGDAVADGEAGDVDGYVAHAEKEDDAEEEQQVIVARDHVFRAQVEKGSGVGACDALEEIGVVALHGVRENRRSGEQQRQ
jgi:hypothetical protein